jgi:nucleoside-triphosphatase THEP1
MFLVVVSGGKGSGKTTACSALRARCREMGVSVGGVLSPRRFDGERHVGYDCLDCSTGELFPLARVRDIVSGGSWVSMGGLRYVFSRDGLERANGILVSASGALKGGVAFVDEVGRLEMRGHGLHDGLMALLVRRAPGVLVASCRLGADRWLEDFAKARSLGVRRQEAGDVEGLLDSVQSLLPSRRGS